MNIPSTIVRILLVTACVYAQIWKKAVANNTWDLDCERPEGSLADWTEGEAWACTQLAVFKSQLLDALLADDSILPSDGPRFSSWEQSGYVSVDDETDIADCVLYPRPDEEYFRLYTALRSIVEFAGNSEVSRKKELEFFMAMLKHPKEECSPCTTQGQAFLCEFNPTPLGVGPFANVYGITTTISPEDEIADRPATAYDSLGVALERKSFPRLHAGGRVSGQRIRQSNCRRRLGRHGNQQRRQQTYNDKDWPYWAYQCGGGFGLGAQFICDSDAHESFVVLELGGGGGSGADFRRDHSIKTSGGGGGGGVQLYDWGDCPESLYERTQCEHVHRTSIGGGSGGSYSHRDNVYHTRATCDADAVDYRGWKKAFDRISDLLRDKSRCPRLRISGGGGGGGGGQLTQLSRLVPFGYGYGFSFNAYFKHPP